MDKDSKPDFDRLQELIDGLKAKLAAMAKDRAKKYKALGIKPEESGRLLEKNNTTLSSTQKSQLEQNLEAFKSTLPSLELATVPSKSSDASRKMMKKPRKMI